MLIAGRRPLPVPNCAIYYDVGDCHKPVEAGVGVVPTTEGQEPVMRKADIKVGGIYLAKVSGTVVRVKVLNIRTVTKTAQGRQGEVYDVENMQTGRKTLFRSAAKFREEVALPKGTSKANKNAEAHGGDDNSEGEKRSDPIKQVTPTPTAAPVKAAALGGGGRATPLSPSGSCLGYTPNEVSGLCRCAVCRGKPRDQRTKRPADTAQVEVVRQDLLGNDVVMSSRDAEAVVVSVPIPLPQKAPPAKPVLVSPGTHRLSALGALGSVSLEFDTAPHVIVEARAGTGKTTTMIEGLRVMLGFGTHITPSPQQQAVWDQLMLSKDKAKSICCVAFNKSIAAELKRRVPPGVEAMTMHGLGFRAINRAVRLWGGDRSVTEWRTSNIMEELLKSNIQDLRRSKPMMVKAVQELVGLCKVNLIGLGYGKEFQRPDHPRIVIGNDELDLLVDHFDIEMEGTTRDEVYPLVVRVLQRCLDVEKDRCIDYDDMIWLPVVLGMPVQRYDILLGDEVQDWNRCQQALAKMAGERLILVGDPKQAIYGFAGADNESMSRMARELGYLPRLEYNGDDQNPEFAPAEVKGRGCVVLPLTVTRRCGRAIVKEANKIVPEFEAHESNPEGKVTYAAMKADDSVGKHAAKRADGALVTAYQSMATDGDMVLCRVNAPLVSECFKFIKSGRKANIQGRDVGKGLVKTVEKMKAKDVAELVMKLEMWCTSEVEKEQKKKYPSEARIIATQDKLDCLLCFIDGVESKGSPALVTQKIDAVFTDDKHAPGIRLSSIHRAKGLEANRVFFLMPEGAGCPHPLANTAWQKEQELNLLYVGITRAISELVFVS